jgi:uncharacterized protein YdbL (DUF1318 family)
MAKFSKQIIPISFALIFLVSCAGIPGFSGGKAELSEENVALLAGQIEEAVLYSNPSAPASDFKLDETTGEVTGDFEPLDLIIGPEHIREKAPALAQLHADTEPMLSAVRGRILRRPAVYDLQQRGCVGESHRGYVKNIKGKACSGDRHARDRAAYVVLLENRDRRAIYEEIVKTQNLSSSDIDRVERIFGEQIRQKAWAGTPLENDGGDWERK